MKRFLILLIAVLLMLSSVSCAPLSSPIIKTITVERDSREYQYSIVYENGRIRKAKPFSADEATVYYVDCSRVYSNIVNGKVVNNAKNVTIYDADKNAVSDQVLSDIVQITIKSIDHDIIDFKIFDYGEQYFIFVKLNTNWSDPCELYKYESTTQSIQYLYTWQNVNLIGIAEPAE